MNYFLILTFLFAVGSLCGWGIEVIYRRSVSQKHWVNPGFLSGPCLPLYGFSLCILYLLATLEDVIPINILWLKKAALFALMALAITVLEYIVGRITVDLLHIRLWDYTKCFGNIRGIICPQYSFYWMILSASYYFLVHPHILDALHWLALNLAFSFGIGFFYGILTIDLAYSLQIMKKISTFANEKQIVVRLEALREEINTNIQKRKRFLLSLRTDRPFIEVLEQYHKKFEEKFGKK